MTNPSQMFCCVSPTTNLEIGLSANVDMLILCENVVLYRWAQLVNNVLWAMCDAFTTRSVAL